MEIKIEGKPQEEVIHSRTIRTILFYLLLSTFMLSGFLIEKYIAIPYKYLFVSPSFYNNPILGWTSSVWSGVLGIHGTIAALSITFMGMLVEQASKSSEYGFESLSKVLLLRSYRFLDFSIQSVCSLLCGVFLLLIGSGLIGYLISMYLSMSFIVRYGVMYYKLYNLTEKPDLIKRLLFDAIESIGTKYKKLNESRLNLINEFKKLGNKYDYIYLDHDSMYWNKDAITLNVFPAKTSDIVSGFIPNCLEQVSKVFNELNHDEKPKIFFDFSFLSPLSNSSVKILTSKDNALDAKFIETIEEILKGGFVYNSVPYIYGEFKLFEEALVNNVRNSLLNGNEWSLDFGVKTFNALTSHGDYKSTLKNIDLSITASNKKDIIETSILSKFFEKMVSEALKQNNLEKSVDIMRGLIDLSRYIYSAENYFDFYKNIFSFFEYRIKYRADESNFILFDLYSTTVMKNFAYGNSKAFDIDTKFVTKSIKYLDLNNKSDYDHLNDVQRKMLSFVFEVVTLILMRIEHVINKVKVKDGSEELKSLSDCLKSWVNAEFLEEIYFKKETYHMLFSVPHEYSLFNVESKIREISDGEATWRSISNDTYKMMAFMLTQSSFNTNRFNLIFVRDGRELKLNTTISTHEISSIVSYIRGDNFTELMKVVTDTEEVQSNKEQVAKELESISSSMSSLILDEVMLSDLNQQLVEEYIKQVNLSAEKFFELIVPLNDITLVIGVDGGDLNILISKREVISAVDGVSYSMNVEGNSKRVVYDWIFSVLNRIDYSKVSVIEINSLQELHTEKLISIEYKVKDRVNTYRYSKGLRVNDKDGHLGLNGSGMYFLDLVESYDLERENEILKTNIEKIDDSNLTVIKDKFDFKNDNPYLYSLIHVDFKLSATQRDGSKLYYLSEEKCREINERQEREMEQLLQKNIQDNADNETVS